MTKTLETLTAREVHQIAFLTMHGWEPDWACEKWRKEGYMNQKFPPGRWSCLEHEMVDTEWFDLDTAYWEQMEALDKLGKDEHDTIPSPPPDEVGTLDD